MLEFLSHAHLHGVDTLVLSSSQVDQREITTPNAWYPTGGPWPFPLWPGDPPQSTHPRMMSLVNPHCRQTAAHLPSQLTLGSLRSVRFMGSTWQRCVRDRPLGWRWFSENTRAELLVDPLHVLDGDGQHPDLDSDPLWLPRGDGTFRLGRRFRHHSDWCSKMQQQEAMSQQQPMTDPEQIK
jgi:hypothetical protein